MNVQREKIKFPERIRFHLRHRHVYETFTKLTFDSGKKIQVVNRIVGIKSSYDDTLLHHETCLQFKSDIYSSRKFQKSATWKQLEASELLD